MATKAKTTTHDWKIGDRVTVGMLKNLHVKSITPQGNLIQFTLVDSTTGKEYTFVPGGLRKTFDPPTPAAPTPTHTNSVNSDLQSLSNAVNLARKVLKTRCNRAGDEGTRKDLESLVDILTRATVTTLTPNAQNQPNAGQF